MVYQINNIKSAKSKCLKDRRSLALLVHSHQLLLCISAWQLISSGEILAININCRFLKWYMVTLSIKSVESLPKLNLAQIYTRTISVLIVKSHGIWVEQMVQRKGRGFNIKEYFPFLELLHYQAVQQTFTHLPEPRRSLLSLSNERNVFLKGYYCILSPLLMFYYPILFYSHLQTHIVASVQHRDSVQYQYTVCPFMRSG